MSSRYEDLRRRWTEMADREPPKAFVLKAEYHEVDMTVHICLQDGGWWAIPRDTLQEEASQYALTKARQGKPDFGPIYAGIFMAKPYLFEFRRRSRVTLRSKP